LKTRDCLKAIKEKNASVMSTIPLWQIGDLYKTNQLSAAELLHVLKLTDANGSIIFDHML
jgi:hypothetical protein